MCCKVNHVKGYMMIRLIRVSSLLLLAAGTSFGQSVEGAAALGFGARETGALRCVALLDRLARTSECPPGRIHDLRLRRPP